MKPSSSSSNKSTKPPTRKSTLRNNKNSLINKKLIPTNIYNQSLFGPENTQSIRWIKIKGYYVLELEDADSLQLITQLDIKIEKCAHLINSCIHSFINNCPFPIKSSTELLIATASLLKDVPLPYIFLSLLNSNIAKKCIKNRERTLQSNDCPKMHFSILMKSLEEIFHFIQTSARVGYDFEFKNRLPLHLENAFHDTVSSIFKDKNITKSSDEEDIKDIILSASNLIGDRNSFRAQKLLVEEALKKNYVCIQKIVNQVCLFFINSGMLVPSSGKELFYFIEQNTQTKIESISSIKNLKIWLDCIFCTIAQLFLKEDPNRFSKDSCELFKSLQCSFPKIVESSHSIYLRKQKLINRMLNKLISTGTKDYTKSSILPLCLPLDIANSLATACNNLTTSFDHLKQLLHLIFKKESKTCKRGIEDFFSKFDHSLAKEILLIAFQECDSSMSAINAKHIYHIDSSESVKNIFNLKAPENISTRMSLKTETCSNIISNTCSLEVKKLAVECALKKITDSMQESVNQVCTYLINVNMSIPLSGQEMIFFIEKNAKIDLKYIEQISDVRIWMECIFCSIARIFLKGTPEQTYTESFQLFTHLQCLFSDIVELPHSLETRKQQMIKHMSTQLISNVSDQAPFYRFPITLPFNLKSSFSTSCNDLTVSFVHLKQLIHILLKRLTNNILSQQTDKKYIDKKKEIISSLDNPNLSEILIAAIKECESSAINKTHMNLSSKSEVEIFNIPVPERVSRNRSEAQIGHKITTYTTKSLIPTNETKISQYAQSQSKRTLSTLLLKNDLTSEEPKIKRSANDVSTIIGCSSPLLAEQPAQIPDNTTSTSPVVGINTSTENTSLITSAFQENQIKESLQSTFTLEKSSLNINADDGEIENFDWVSLLVSKSTPSTSSATFTTEPVIIEEVFDDLFMNQNFLTEDGDRE